MKISIFYRKQDTEKYSIEKVYDTLLPYFLSDFKISTIKLPCKSKGLIRRIVNTIYATFKQNNINHISGDINYINLFMRKKNTILTIHDIYPLERTFGLKRFLLKLFWFTIPIKKSEKIITISYFSKSEILKYFKLPEDKIKVIYNCISPKYIFSKSSFNQKNPCILHIGTKPNKNLERLILALNGIPCHLIIIGKLNDDLKLLLSENKINYTEKIELSNDHIINEYKSCDILSFVSTYEGFGLPIIESQATGRVVLTSNVSSMPEVAGNGAYFVNPFDVNEIKMGVLELITNSILREQLITNGLENVKRFEPQKIANQYKEIYNKVLNEA